MKPKLWQQRKFWVLVVYISLIVLGLLSWIFGIVGCVSAYSYTGTTTEAQQQAVQSQNSAQSSSDRVVLEVPPTTITTSDNTRIEIGGARAETGSQTEQATDQLQALQQKIDMQTEQNSKSSVNLTYMIISGFVCLLLFSAFKIWLYKR